MLEAGRSGDEEQSSSKRLLCGADGNLCVCLITQAFLAPSLYLNPAACLHTVETYLTL